MTNPQTKSYHGNISGNVLVLVSTRSGKATLVQEIGGNSMFGKLQGVCWISKVELSKQREAKIDSSFEAVVDFYNPQDEFDFKRCPRKSLPRKSRETINY